MALGRIVSLSILLSIIMSSVFVHEFVHVLQVELDDRVMYGSMTCPIAFNMTSMDSLKSSPICAVWPKWNESYFDNRTKEEIDYITEQYEKDKEGYESSALAIQFAYIIGMIYWVTLRHGLNRPKQNNSI